MISFRDTPQVAKTYEAPCQHEDDRPQRSTRFVDHGEAARGESSLGEGSENARASIDTGETDGEDGDADGRVDEV